MSIEDKYGGLTNDELMKIAADDGESYVPDAIEAARTVLAVRGVKPPARVAPHVEDLEDQRLLLAERSRRDKRVGAACFLGGIGAAIVFFSIGLYTGWVMVPIFFGAIVYARGSREGYDVVRLDERIRLRAVEEGADDKPQKRDGRVA